MGLGRESGSCWLQGAGHLTFCSALYRSENSISDAGLAQAREALSPGVVVA